MESNKPHLIQSAIREVDFGRDVKVVEPVNLYECSIGAECFIGPFVEIQKGVTIGDNSIVAASSVVTKDVPPNTIVVGNPARVLKNRG